MEKKRVKLLSSFISLVLAGAFLFLAGLSQAAQGDSVSQVGMDSLKRLPIQDSGRIKPFDTFARETLSLVYGSTTYKPANRDTDGANKEKDRRTRPAIEIIMTWFLAPQFWDQQPIVEITLKSLKEALKLDESQTRFAPQELVGNDRIGYVIQDLQAFRETKAKLTPYYQAVARLENQLGIYQAVKAGTVLRFVPPTLQSSTEKEKRESADPLLPKAPDMWRSVAELEGPLKEGFAGIAKSFIHELPGSGAPEDTVVPGLQEAVKAFTDLARAENPSLYPDGKDIGIEVHYEELHPFRLAWIFYVTAALIIGGAWISGRKWAMSLGWAVAVLAFLVHTYGFGLRMYLTGRPPVSNMYESVIWVSWGAMVFAFFFEWRQRAKFILLSGTIVATLCNIITDSVPHVLDASIQPLEPVLRSNLWLTVHVLTITISYSAFFLAWMIGNLGLGFIIKGDKPQSPRIEGVVIAVYRCMQVGVVLLAAGIILGGVWADYSWGRFWGWDPKETWALIAMLGYIALLHARLSGWVKQLGMLMGAVVSFNLVVMAWYGVNFVLGAGLHSYGFGAGGVEYMAAVVLLNLAYVGYAYMLARSRHAISNTKGA